MARDGAGPQLDLFGGGTSPDAADGIAPVSDLLGPAKVSDALREVAGRLPASVRLGGCSWIFPGWAGLVFDRKVPIDRLRSEGLKAYARHPLLRTVCVDRTYYAPVPPSLLQRYAQEVPKDFRFVVKAHDVLTLPRFPDHPRYGARRGTRNAHYLSPSYAAEAVVGPYVEGLGEKAGALLFQFSPPSPLAEPVEVEAFPDQLHRFLSALPKGPRYAVELRDPSLLTPRYGQALAAAGTIHALNVWGSMPELERQADLVQALGKPELLIRWMLPSTLSFAEAEERYTPFDRLGSVDPEVRASVVRLCRQAAARNKPVCVLISNHAEGSAPLTAFDLARALVA